MKTILTGFLLFALAGIAEANTITWQDNSDNETGFAIEMLTRGTWTEVARVGEDVTTYTDKLNQGVYRVRAFVTVPGEGDLFSGYSNTAARLNSPVNLNVK